MVTFLLKVITRKKVGQKNFKWGQKMLVTGHKGDQDDKNKEMNGDPFRVMLFWWHNSSFVLLLEYIKTLQSWNK